MRPDAGHRGRRGELAWIEAREGEAREGVRRSVRALGDDLTLLLGLGRPTDESRLARQTLEGAGAWLASERGLAAIESALAGAALGAARACLRDERDDDV